MRRAEFMRCPIVHAREGSLVDPGWYRALVSCSYDVKNSCKDCDPLKTAAVRETILTEWRGLSRARSWIG
jgi:hypothetical protein